MAKAADKLRTKMDKIFDSLEKLNDAFDRLNEMMEDYLAENEEKEGE